VDRAGGRSYARLVERQRSPVASKIADVTDLDGEVVAGLPLDVKDVVDGVWSCLAVVDSERKTGAPASICEARWKEVDAVAGFLWGGPSVCPKDWQVAKPAAVSHVGIKPR